MSKYKLAVTGYDVIELEAKSIEDARDQVFEQGLNHLYSLEVMEVVPANEGFKLHTDLN